MAICAWICLTLAFPQSARYGTNPTLAKELIVRAKRDQDARTRMLARKDPNDQARAGKLIMKVDAENLTRMRQIVDRSGWPTRTLVGREASGDAWLLVQHDVADKPFMRRCLNLMLPFLDTGEVQKDEVALLLDRVREGEGKLQYYGSQWRFTPGGDIACGPIQDSDTVDARRKAMGLPTMAEYEKMLRKAYANMFRKK